MCTLSRFYTAVVIIGAATLCGVKAQTSLHADERINGKLVWEAFEPQREILQRSSAVIYTDGKSRLKTCYGVVVSESGHVLTKASEIQGKTNITMRVGRELYEEVQVLATDPEWDIAMLKVSPEEPLVPVEFSDEADVPQGHWVISNGSASRSKRRVRVGIVSAITREIPSAMSRVVLGVQLGSGKKDGLAIQEVSEKSGAEKAGIKKGDVLVAAGGVELKKRADLLEALKKKNPGDKLDVQVLRGKKKMNFEVELMAREGGPRMTRNDQMSGGEFSLSKRRDGFPRVLHHDTPLTKSSVGGPLLNLSGKCVGMNIARASRVATFAIPARELKEIIEEMTAQ